MWVSVTPRGRIVRADIGVDCWVRAEYKVQRPMDKPLLIFDGECKFCRFWIGRWHRATGDNVEYVPSQAAWVRGRFPEIPVEEYDNSVQLVESDGLVYSGAESALRALSVSPRYQWLLRWYYKSALFSRFTEWAYRRVSDNRPFLSVINRWVFGKRAGRHA